MRRQSNIQRQHDYEPQASFKNRQDMRHTHNSDKNTADPFLQLVRLLLCARRPYLVVEHMPCGTDTQSHVKHGYTNTNPNYPAHLSRSDAPAE